MADQKTSSSDKKKGAKVKRPSAKKRNLQSEAQRLRNRSLRSSVNTAIRSLEAALEQKVEPEKIKSQLDAVYSIVDKSVKRGVFKPQKAARTKSRLSLRCSKA